MIFSKVLRKPICCYNSTGFVKKHDKRAQGLEILIGLNQLESWVLNQSNF